MISSRREKGASETIYLREVKIIGELNREYEVMGMSGNKYTLWIHKSPACTCPDFNGRGGRCKHIYYVMDKILHVDDAIINKDELSEDDLRVIFGKPIQKPSEEPSGTITVSDSRFEMSYLDMAYSKLAKWIGCFDVKDE